MDSFSVAEAARLLGVSEPRVYRALAGLGVVADGHLHLAPGQVIALARRWGWVPPALRDRGLRREEVFVLAALATSPLGLRSARSVARRAGISPVTATRALGSLGGRCLVEEGQQRIVEGSVTDVAVWRIAWRSPEWATLAPLVASVVLPAPKPSRSSPASSSKRRTVPSRFGHLFWNEDTAKLDVERDGTLIAGRILGAGDAQAIAWAGRAIPPASLRRVRGLRKVEPSVAALADALAGGR